MTRRRDARPRAARREAPCPRARCRAAPARGRRRSWPLSSGNHSGDDWLNPHPAACPPPPPPGAAPLPHAGSLSPRPRACVIARGTLNLCTPHARPHASKHLRPSGLWALPAYPAFTKAIRRRPNPHPLPASHPHPTRGGGSAAPRRRQWPTHAPAPPPRHPSSNATREGPACPAPSGGAAAGRAPLAPLVARVAHPGPRFGSSPAQPRADPLVNPV